MALRLKLLRNYGTPFAACQPNAENLFCERSERKKILLNFTSPKIHFRSATTTTLATVVHFYEYIATAKQNDSFVANTFEVVLRLRLHLEGVNTLVCQTRHFVFNRLYVNRINFSLR